MWHDDYCDCKEKPVRRQDKFFYDANTQNYVLKEYNGLILHKSLVDSMTVANIKVIILAKTGSMPSDYLILDIKRHSRHIDS